MEVKETEIADFEIEGKKETVLKGRRDNTIKVIQGLPADTLAGFKWGLAYWEWKPIRGLPFKNVLRIDLRTIEIDTIPEARFCCFVGVTEVYFPKTLRVIDTAAFLQCKKLTDIWLPEGLEVIGNQCFAECSSLKVVKLPTTVVSLGTFSFSETGLEKINFPKALETIGFYAFNQAPLKVVLLEFPRDHLDGLKTILAEIEDAKFVACEDGGLVGEQIGERKVEKANQEELSLGHPVACDRAPAPTASPVDAVGVQSEPVAIRVLEDGKELAIHLNPLLSIREALDEAGFDEGLCYDGAPLRPKTLVGKLDLNLVYTLK